VVSSPGWALEQIVTFSSYSVSASLGGSVAVRGVKAGPCFLMTKRQTVEMSIKIEMITITVKSAFFYCSSGLCLWWCFVVFIGFLLMFCAFYVFSQFKTRSVPAGNRKLPRLKRHHIMTTQIFTSLLES
jgi:hypothetical protein